MKRFLAAGLAAVLLVALGALVALGSRGGAASAAQYQYKDNPSLALSITEFYPNYYYTIHVEAAHYFSGSEPGGQLQLTCDKAASTCGPEPPPWSWRQASEWQGGPPSSWVAVPLRHRPSTSGWSEYLIPTRQPSVRPLVAPVLDTVEERVPIA